MNYSERVGVATQRLSPDRLEEKTRSHGVSGSAGGKSLLLCQPPQPNGFFHVHKQQPSIEVGPGSRFGRDKASVAGKVYSQAGCKREGLRQRLSRDWGNKHGNGTVRRAINSPDSLDAVENRSNRHEAPEKRYIVLQVKRMAKVALYRPSSKRLQVRRLWGQIKRWRDSTRRPHQTKIKISRVCIGPGESSGALRCLQYRQRRRGSYYVLGPPSRYRLEGVTRSGRYTKLTAGITGWNRAARGEVSTGTRQG